MKIIVIGGSPRKNGNTERVATLLQRSLASSAEARDIPLEMEYISLCSTEIGTCRGCRACFNRGEESCPVKDGLPALYHKLLEADGAVFLSPVYVEDVTGVMKNLIDRLAFCCHRPPFGGKVAAVLTTSGGGSTKHALQTMDRALRAWGYSVEASARFRMGELMGEEEAECRFAHSIQKIADRLLDSLLKKRKKKHSFLSLLYFKIQQTANRKIAGDDTPDSRYWRQSGWLDQKRTYYIENRTNFLVTALARGAGAVMALFFV